MFVSRPSLYLLKPHSESKTLSGRLSDLVFIIINGMNSYFKQKALNPHNQKWSHSLDSPYLFDYNLHVTS